MTLPPKSLPPGETLPGAPKPVSVLLLDDNEDARFLLRRRLESEIPGCVCVEFDDPAGALAALGHARFDAILTDHHLGSSEGVSFIADARRNGVCVPLLMVTNSLDPAVRSAALAAGAVEVFDPRSSEIVAFLRAITAR